MSKNTKSTQHAENPAKLAKTAARKAANKAQNEQQHKDNLDMVAGILTKHVDERTHTTRVFVPANPKVKSSKARYETITTYSQHAERPSKALRRVRREAARTQAQLTQIGADNLKAVIAQG